MKKIIPFGLGLVTTMLILGTSCQKKDQMTSPAPAETNYKSLLVQSPAFVQFTRDFLRDHYFFSAYHRPIQANQEQFLQDVQANDKDAKKLSAVYQKHHLHFGKAFFLRMQMQQDVIDLVKAHPFLETLPDGAADALIVDAMKAGFQSKDSRWVVLRQETLGAYTPRTHRAALAFPGAGLQGNIRSQSTDPSGREGWEPIFDPDYDPGIDPINDFPVNLDLTYDEIVDCAIDAVGLSVKAIIGVGGIKKLAELTVQQAVVRLSSFLLRYAGWWGVAIIGVKFSSCLYKENQD